MAVLHGYRHLGEAYLMAGEHGAAIRLGVQDLEVNHPNLDPSLHATLLGAAMERGWLMSAGSDLHFMGARKPGFWSLGDLHKPLLERIGAA